MEREETKDRAKFGRKDGSEDGKLQSDDFSKNDYLLIIIKRQ
jgi:hypothetical protein